MTNGICIATWILTTHQIWWQSAQPFLSYSLAGKFDTLHAARATCRADPQMSPIWLQSFFLNGSTRQWKSRGAQRYSFGDISFSKALPGRPAAHTQIWSLFKKELRSALRDPLVITDNLSMSDRSAGRYLDLTILPILEFCPVLAAQGIFLRSWRETGILSTCIIQPKPKILSLNFLTSWLWMTLTWYAVTKKLRPVLRSIPGTMHAVSLALFQFDAAALPGKASDGSYNKKVSSLSWPVTSSYNFWDIFGKFMPGLSNAVSGDRESLKSLAESMERDPPPLPKADRGRKYLFGAWDNFQTFARDFL